MPQSKHLDNPTWYQGTADAVRQCLRHLGPFEAEYILILSGDQLYQMNFMEMLNNHIQQKAEITIATIPVADREASEFGILKKDEKGFITSFIEKPKRDVLKDWASDTGQLMQVRVDTIWLLWVYIYSTASFYKIYCRTNM